MGKIDEEKKINLQCPRFLQWPCHLLSKVIEPLLSAGSFFFLPGPKAVELN